VRNRYRRGGRFARYEPAPVSIAVRHRLYRLAVRLRHRTKAKGRKRGVITDAALHIYWHMLFTLADNATGACAPAIDYIAMRAGAARSTVCAALRDLERVGLLRVMRRLVRRVVGPAGMRRETTVQDTNAYSFGEPHSYAHLLPVPVGPVRTARLVGNLLGCLSMKDAGTESDARGGKSTKFKKKGFSGGSETPIGAAAVRGVCG
jgi:hypothetical protein